jgi:hypothetical protein
MTTTFGFFSDSALTVPITTLAAVMQIGGTPVDKVVYFGSATASRVAKASSNPGVDQIAVSIVDATLGGGHPATEIKLATTNGGLAGATGGAALNLGVQVASGSANAVPLHIRWTDSVGTVETATELSLACNDINEYTA